jgi:acetyltransferase-like isoleucine patch superfamily enzyme
MVTIRDHEHVIAPPNPYRQSGFVSAPIHLGTNVSICNRVTITRGVTIGASAVVAASAIVTRDAPPNTIVGGVPAVTIRSVTGTNAGSCSKAATAIEVADHDVQASYPWRVPWG